MFSPCWDMQQAQQRRLKVVQYCSPRQPEDQYVIVDKNIEYDDYLILHHPHFMKSSLVILNRVLAFQWLKTQVACKDQLLKNILSE